MLASLDTNVLLSNIRALRPSNDLKLVLAEAKRGTFELIVSSLVVEETINKRQEAARESLRRLRRAHADLASAGAKIDAFNVDLELVEQRIRESVLALFSQPGCRIQPLPTVAHESLVQRALDRRKPFAINGVGYRDALLWESVLCLVLRARMRWSSSAAIQRTSLQTGRARN